MMLTAPCWQLDVLVVVVAAGALSKFTVGALWAVSGGLEEHHGLLGVIQGRGPDHAWKGVQRGVVLAHGLVVVAPGHGDAVLGSLQLGLQGQKVLVRLQLGIVLAGHQQPAQRPGQALLGLGELGDFSGVAHLFGVDVDLGGRGAGLGHLDQHALLLGGVALHGGHQVRNQVGAALVVCLQVAELGLGLLLKRWDGVGAAAAQNQWQGDQGGETVQAAQRWAPVQQSFAGAALAGRVARWHVDALDRLAAAAESR